VIGALMPILMVLAKTMGEKINPATKRQTTIHAHFLIATSFFPDH
jgi:hypothetical protein